MRRMLALPALFLFLGVPPVVAGSHPQNLQSPAWLFAMPPELTAYVAPQAPVVASEKPGEGLVCTATEDCNELPDISCSGSVCGAVTRNCSNGANQRGSVTCDGVTILCSRVCPPPPDRCTLDECRAPCRQAGCFSSCVDRQNCVCEAICF